MKRIFVIAQTIIIVCVSGGCIRQVPTETPTERVYYREGYIYTIDGQPIQGLRVYHAEFSDAYKKVGGITNEHGYFKFEPPVEWKMTKYMYIRSEGKTIDSIETRVLIIPHHHRHRRRKYDDGDRRVFENGRVDTFFVDMERKGRSFEVLQDHKRPERRYYEGYIYTIEGQPIRNLNVYPTKCPFPREEEWKGCTNVDSAGGITNEHGYFKFDQPRYWIPHYLYIGSEGRMIDSIYRGPFVGKLPLPITFDDKTADTFFVDMEGKGRSFRVLQGQTRIPMNDF
jgi:hypothetical protein